MTIGFQGGLDQSEILSDGTPFDGANIDAKISSAGANIPDPSDFVIKQERISDTANNSSINIDYTLEGPGWLFAFWLSADTSNTFALDGEEVDYTNSGGNPTFAGYRRFENELTLEASSDFDTQEQVRLEYIVGLET